MTNGINFYSKLNFYYILKFLIS